MSKQTLIGTAVLALVMQPVRVATDSRQAAITGAVAGWAGAPFKWMWTVRRKWKSRATRAS